MRRIVLLLILSGYVCHLNAQTTYSINIDVPEKEIIRGHLDLGGSNPSGDSISVNSYFIELNGEAFFPVIGEFHFSRYPSKYWEESIQKMKAGGINTIATYIFWNIHERIEGQFDWEGNLNLRRFIELIEKNGMYAIVRMGPFCHGEMRNGGIPDWLYGRTFEIRSNDPEYLAYVDRLYGEIAQQIEGELYKDGGPIVGIQLENEFQHSAAPWEYIYPGSRKEYTIADQHAALANEQITITDGVNPWSAYGKEHMRNLKALAIKHGVDVPLYTATGWGNATIVEKGSIPVTAGYVYPFWAKPDLSPFYLFKDIHKHPDYAPVSYEPELYPSLAAEIGPGIQVKYSRRPVVDYRSVKPLMVRIIGSGSNGIGYYMYHGGSTPVFDGKFYNEEVNGLPRINYDFQAPVGQYGQTRYHFKSLRMLHMFLESYGTGLAQMKTILPETNAGITPGDTKTLRYAVRSYEKSGFVFIVNFQDHHEIEDINNIRIEVEGKNEKISFPATGPMDILRVTSAILPFNLELENVMVRSATVQPLTVLQNINTTTYVFTAIDGIQPEMVFPSTTSISELNNAKQTKHGAQTLVTGSFSEPFSFWANGSQFLILPGELALNTTKIEEQLVISNALILEDHANLQYISRKESSYLHIFPATEHHPLATFAEVDKAAQLMEGFSSYILNFTQVTPEIKITKASDRKYALTLKSDISDLNDVFVEVDYIGDRGMAFLNGELITDHFYHEKKWEISLKKSIPSLKENDKMVLIFHPMYPDYEYLIDLHNIPDFENNGYLKVNGFEIIPEYKAVLSIN